MLLLGAGKYLLFPIIMYAIAKSVVAVELPMILQLGLTLAIVVGLSVADVSQNAVANLGWDDVKLTAPVFAGDTIYAESEVIEVRPSRSRPTQGLVRVRTRGFNQRGETVINYERTVLVYTRAARPLEPGP